jgi:8-oxo-dGTP pyrophosphatase MutT (NUDIX family)
MRTAVLDVVARHLPDDGLIYAPGDVAADLQVPHDRLRDGDVKGLPPSSCTAAVMINDELSHAGVHAEETVDTLGSALEPSGVLVASLHNRVFAAATRQVWPSASLLEAGEPVDTRGFSAAEAAALLNHRGFTIDIICAPGAAARLRGAEAFDLDADRAPGLLDAGPRLLIVARAPIDAEARARVFFQTRPRKLAAAGTICRDADGRLLVVYDRFRRLWTIPGGVVDADEDPAAAAQRETWEEGGVNVEIGRLLGVFASRWPDRLILVFAATPTTMVDHPEPLHPHEIGEVVWLPLDQALQRLAPNAAFRVTRCLEQPGHAWVQ